MSAAGDPARAKAALRAAVRERARGLSADERARRSEALVRRVLTDPAWRAATAVVGFVGRGHEPDTGPLLAAALAAGRPLYLPRVARRDPPALAFAAVRDLDALRPGAFRIPEPSGEAAPLPPGALILVPGLAFDPAGRRLGHGWGFYDAALADPPPGAVLVGLCLAPFLVERVPAGPRDVPVHRVVTDEGSYGPPA